MNIMSDARRDMADLALIAAEPGARAAMRRIVEVLERTRAALDTPVRIDGDEEQRALELRLGAAYWEVDALLKDMGRP